MTDDRCRSHEGLVALEHDESGTSCQNCGRLLSVRDCPTCGKTFLDFTAKSYDDTVSAPYLTASDELCCIPCRREMDRLDCEEEEEDWEEDDHDPWEDWG